MWTPHPQKSNNNHTGDPKRLAITQTLVKDYQLTMVRKKPSQMSKTIVIDLARELKKMWIVKVTVIPTVTVLYFDLRPGQKCHSKVMHWKKVTHSNGSYERKSRGRKLADEMGRGKKFPWYTHRLMHRKRVTCELHDWFPLDDDQTCDSKYRVGDWVGVELLYNPVKTDVRQLEIWRRCGKESHTRPKGLSGTPMEFEDQTSWRKVADKMQ